MLSGFEAYTQNSIGNLVIKNKYKADHYFLDLYYEEAIKYYKLALKNDRNKSAIRVKIGDCYRLLNDYSRAAIWYKQGLENDSIDVLQQKPIYAYYYADMLMANEKYEDAGQ